MNERNLGPTMVGLAVAAAIGVVAFLAALWSGVPLRAWEAFLVNFVFWLGVAQGGVAVSASFYLSNARWAGAGLYRLAEAFVGFLPLAFVLFWALFAGRHLLYVWVDHPLAYKRAWLNVPFFFLRDGVGLLFMLVVSLWFVHLSRRPEVRRWADNADDIDNPPPPIRAVACILLIGYAVIYTMLAFDLVMSLAPRWHSTLFGAYFFAGAYWSALVAMGLVATTQAHRDGGLEPERERGALHDIGKMVFAFSVFWVYLLFSQYIVIWYGDIPSETFFVVPRVQHLPWGALSWTVLGLVWAVPFCVLLGRRPKRTRSILGGVCALGLIGMWLERYVLVVPSLSPRRIPFGWVELLVTIGFLGLFGLCAQWGLRQVGPLTRPASFGGAE